MAWYEVKNSGAVAADDRYKHLKIGGLAIQGAVAEHLQSLESCGAGALAVRKPSALAEVDGLIIPGGESTTISRLGRLYGFMEGIYHLVEAGKPLFGTCAGLVMMAREVEGQQPVLALLSITARRNAFGRQRESFEADLDIPVLGGEPFCGGFIRAPVVTSVFGEAQVLARINGIVVAARERNCLATSFHPELTDDLRLHRYFLEMALLGSAPKAARQP